MNCLVPSGVPRLVLSGVRPSCHQEYASAANQITALACAAFNCSNPKALTDRSAAAAQWTTAESWEQQRSALQGQDGFPEGTPALRARIKVSAFTQGVTVAEPLRALLERETPESTP